MPTRGRFVCHVHCLVHDGAVRSSPCGPHHENFGRNLYHMFVPAYSASQYFVLFCVVVFELLRSHMLIPYLFKWLLNLWKCDDLLRNSFVHLRSNVYCEDYMLQFLSVDSTCLFVYHDANGCHPLQDGSANASESGTQ